MNDVLLNLIFKHDSTNWQSTAGREEECAGNEPNVMQNLRGNPNALFAEDQKYFIKYWVVYLAVLLTLSDADDLNIFSAGSLSFWMER